MSKIKEFGCSYCGHVWSGEVDENDLYKGYGCPPCPMCGEPCTDTSDYGDWRCPACGHKWRRYGNGGLSYGCIPRCPECRASAERA